MLDRRLAALVLPGRRLNLIGRACGRTPWPPQITECKFCCPERKKRSGQRWGHGSALLGSYCKQEASKLSSVKCKGCRTGCRHWPYEG
jgi:hypothetical protein